MSPHHDHTERNGQGHHWHGGRILKTQEEGSDEILELIWTLREKGVTDFEALLGQAPDPEARASLVRQMILEGLVEIGWGGTPVESKGRGPWRKGSFVVIG